MSGAIGCAGKKCHHAAKAPPRSEFEWNKWELDSGVVYEVFVTRKQGAPVLLLHEMPGLTPGALGLALEMAERGFRVYCPLLFGKFGQNNGALGYLQTQFSPQWKLFNVEDAGKIRVYVGDMLNKIAELEPGERITVIGNCLSGTLPIEAITHDNVETAVICQPALPLKLPWHSDRSGHFGFPEEVIQAAIDAVAATPSKKIISFNYLNDKIAPIERTVAFVGLLVEKKVIDQYRLVVACENETELPEVLSSGSLGASLHQIAVPDDGEHSTLTGAPAADRDAFRAKLFELLDES